MFGQRPDLAAKRRPRAVLEKEVARMVEAIKAGAFSGTLKGERERAETKRKKLLAVVNADTLELDKVATERRCPGASAGAATSQG